MNRKDAMLYLAMISIVASPVVHAQARPLLSNNKSPSAQGALAPVIDEVRVENIHTGYLEVIWEDTKNGSGPERLKVSLVNEKGRRKLSTEQAQLAAEDLSSLSGQKVAAYLSPSSGELLAMVPAVPTFSATQSALQNSTSGNHHWKTLACKFSDIPQTPVSVGFLKHQYGRMRGHIGHYWHDMSYGNLRINGTAHGWFALPYPKAHYLLDGSLDTASLGRDCINAALPFVDLSQTHGINIALNDDVDHVARGGRLCADFPGARQACTPMTWLPTFGYRSLRTMMHEMGHAYSLPHSDNSDGDADTYDNYWDVMSYIGWAPSTRSWEAVRNTWLPGTDTG